MIERVHEHIITELQQNVRTDTIFVQIAIVLNFEFTSISLLNFNRTYAQIRFLSRLR